jgi:hypothetical protein
MGTENKEKEVPEWKRMWKPALLIMPFLLGILGHVIWLSVKRWPDQLDEKGWLNLFLIVLEVFCIFIIMGIINDQTEKREKEIYRLKGVISWNSEELTRRNEQFDGLALELRDVREKLRETQEQLVWTKANLLDGIVRLCKKLREFSARGVEHSWVVETRMLWVRRLMLLVREGIIPVDTFILWFPDIKVIKDVVDEDIGTAPLIYHRKLEPWQLALVQHVNPLPKDGDCQPPFKAPAA